MAPKTYFFELGAALNSFQFLSHPLLATSCRRVGLACLVSSLLQEDLYFFGLVLCMAYFLHGFHSPEKSYLPLEYQYFEFFSLRNDDYSPWENGAVLLLASAQTFKLLFYLAFHKGILAGPFLAVFEDGYLFSLATACLAVKRQISCFVSLCFLLPPLYTIVLLGV